MGFDDYVNNEPIGLKFGGLFSLGHAMTEYEYNEWMWCTRYLKGAIHTGKRLIIAIHKTTGFASLMLQDALGVLEVFAFDHIEKRYGKQSSNAWSNPIENIKDVNKRFFGD